MNEWDPIDGILIGKAIRVAFLGVAIEVATKRLGPREAFALARRLVRQQVCGYELPAEFYQHLAQCGERAEAEGVGPDALFQMMLGAVKAPYPDPTAKGQ